MRVLIAEDEKDLNKILTDRLKAEHYSVDSCYDGQETLDYLASAEYDAVILDIMMPVLDGLSVLRTMRRKNDSTPVLLLTAKDSIEDRVQGLDAGANDYLVKPLPWRSCWRGSGCSCAGRRRRRRPATGLLTWRCTWIPGRSCAEGRR